MLGDNDLDDDLEVIPTAVPRAGTAMKRHVIPASHGGGAYRGSRPILSEEDLRRVNTRRGLHSADQEQEHRSGRSAKTCSMEQELRQLQVELVRLQRWVQADGQRIAILVEGRDAPEAAAQSVGSPNT